MSRRRFASAGGDDSQSAIAMDTSIGSDGERSDSYEDDVTPPTTPAYTSMKQDRQRYVLNLKFSIDNILKPDFGRKHRLSATSAGSDSSGSPHTFATTPSPMASPGCVSQTPTAPSRVESGLGQNSNERNGDSEPATTPVSLWPAWVYCTRYSDRPSSGPRCRRVKRKANITKQPEEKRPRTAFTGDQLARLKAEFQENRYLTEKRRQELARELGLNESQIKIWFQNKRAKIKKQTGGRNMLALHLMAQGLYNHSTVPVGTEGHEDDDDDMEDIDVDDDRSTVLTPADPKRNSRS